MYQISKKQSLKKFKKTKFILNRQEVDKYFYQWNIYISYISSFLKKKALDKDTFPFIIEKHKSIDIDDILYDFKLGEIKLKISRHN